MKVNYISNISLNEVSGGWSGMNYHVCKELQRHFDVNILDPINPAFSLRSKLASKALRVLGLRGKFPAFTKERLVQIAREIRHNVERNPADIIFYHGSTSWIGYQNNTPYAMYLDACFATYINVYHNPNHFSKKQLAAVMESEIRFLGNASTVFFSSQWALEDTRKRYAMNGVNFVNAGLGGSISENGLDNSKNEELFFLFVGLDFIGKGGEILVRAFNNLRLRLPGYQLKIVGQSPPPEFLKMPGIQYVGFLNKNIPSERSLLEQLFRTAIAFVLPTSKDMTPLVIVEAASAGCPVISVRNFGIPEMIVHMETGILIEPGIEMEVSLEKAMELIVADKELRQKMRRQTKAYITDHFDWNRTGEIISRRLIELKA